MMRFEAIFRYFIWLFLLVLTLFIHEVQASQAQLNQLVQDKHLLIRSYIDKPDGIAVNEQVILKIELLTDTWFTKGTRIHRFDIANTLVIQRNNFATNSTVRLNGKPYSKQVWEVNLYPLASGDYQIPSIIVDVSVRGEKSSIAGTLQTKPLSFSTHIPDAKFNLNETVVSDDATVNQQWRVVKADGSEYQTNDSLRVGDAIERTVTLRVRNTTASLIPNLIPTVEPNRGVIEYPQSPRLLDEQDRGVYSSQRIEKVVYVVKDAGELVLPQHELSIWDPSQSTLSFIDISSQQYQIKHTVVTFIRQYSMEVGVGLVIVIILIIGAYFFIKTYRILEKEQRLPLFWQYLLAIKQQDYVRCEFLLYKKCRQTSTTVTLNSNTHQLKRKIINGLQHRYQKQAEDSGIEKQPNTFVYAINLVILYTYYVKLFNALRLRLF